MDLEEMTGRTHGRYISDTDRSVYDGISPETILGLVGIVRTIVAH